MSYASDASPLYESNASPLLEVVLQNNQGILQLMRGDFQLALMHLDRAVRLCNELVVQGVIGDAGTINEDILTLVELPMLHDSTFYIYNCGFLLDPFAFRQDLVDGTCMGASAIVMFNTGLAFHQAAMAYPSTDCSNSVLNFYSTCIKLIMRKERHCCFSTAMVAAATNNLAHANFHFFSCRHLTMRYLSTIEAHLPSLVMNPSMLRNNLTDIGANMLFARMLWSSPAAAA